MNKVMGIDKATKKVSVKFEELDYVNLKKIAAQKRIGLASLIRMKVCELLKDSSNITL